MAAALVSCDGGDGLPGAARAARPTIPAHAVERPVRQGHDHRRSQVAGHPLPRARHLRRRRLSGSRRQGDNSQAVCAAAGWNQEELQPGLDGGNAFGSYLLTSPCNGPRSQLPLLACRSSRRMRRPMSLKLPSWSSSSAASARRLLSRPGRRRPSFDSPPPPPIDVATNAAEAATTAPSDRMNAVIFIVGFVTWTMSIDTARVPPVRAESLNRDTGTAQRC